MVKKKKKEETEDEERGERLKRHYRECVCLGAGCKVTVGVHNLTSLFASESLKELNSSKRRSCAASVFVLDFDVKK